MACIKITKTNNSESLLIKKLEEIFENEYKAEAAYSYFESENFKSEFGDYVEGYNNADKSFYNRVDENGEPKLSYDETANKHYFLDKNQEKIFYPAVKKGLRALFNYKQINKITSRLALNYFNKSKLNFLNFNNISFEERESLPNLKAFIKEEIENKIKELEEKGGKFKLPALILKKSLTNLNEYTDNVYAFYKKASLKIIKIKDENYQKDEDENVKDPSYSKSSFEQDSKDSISTIVKLKLSLLENKEELDPIWNEPTFVSFENVFSLLINNITNQVALEGEDLFDLLKNEIEVLSLKVPYLKELLKFFNDDKFTEQDKNQFTQAFNLHRNNFLISEVQTKISERNSDNETTVKKGYVHTVKEISESGSKAAVITSEWGNNFKNLFLDDNNKFKQGSSEYIVEVQKTIKELKELVKTEMSVAEFEKTVNSLIINLRKLGVETTSKGFISYLDENGALSFDKDKQIDKLSKSITQLDISLKKALKSFSKAKKEFYNPFDEEGLFKKLAKGEALFIGETTDVSIWSSGKNKWLFSYPSYLSTRIKQWQKNPELLKNWKNISAYNKGSALIKYLLAEDLDPNMVYSEGQIEQIINERLENLKLGIFNTFQEKDGEAKDVSELSFKDYFNDVVNKTLAQSYVRTVTPADKGSDMQIKTGFFVDSFNSVLENEDTVFTDEIIEIFFNYFNSEFNRIKEAHNEVDTLKNSPEKLVINYHFKEDSSIDSKTGNAFKSQYFPELSYDSVSSNPQVLQIKDALYVKKNGVYTNVVKHSSNITSNFELKSLINEYIKGQLNQGVNDTLLTFIDEGIFEMGTNDLVNKGIDNNTYQKYLKNNLENNNLALKAIVTDFYTNSLINNVEYSKLFTGDVAFYKNMVDYKKRVPATYSDGLQLRLKKGEEFFNIASTGKIVFTPQEYAKIEEILGKEGAKAYQKNNAADGQAWITPERWKFLVERLGKWTKVHDSVYANMTSDNPKPYSPKELKITAQPLKGVYFYMNGKTPVYLKYSQAVLTKNLIKGTSLQGVYDQMKKQKVDELITLDGIKVGSNTPTDIHNQDGTVKTELNFNVTQLSNYGWKLQQDLPTKTVKQINVGSQIQKNIFAGLLFNKELSGFLLDGNDTNGQSIIDNIVEIVGSLTNVGLSEIKEEFSVFRNGEIKNIKGFYNALVRELEQRGGSKNIIDALNKETALYGIPQSAEKIINIFASIMNDRLINIKTNGGSFIQMSNFGLNKNEAVEQGIRMHPNLENGKTTYEPRFYKDENGKKRVQPGGVFISASFLAKKIPNWRTYTNEELFVSYKGGDPIIDKKIRENLIGYRIPNQGLSSNDSLEIIGIIPEENGDTIVAYTGITTKTGSDFDIDKMFLMMANFSLVEDRLVYDSYDNSISNKKQSKEALQNRLIELYKSVLTHPKVIKDVMKPLDNDIIKNDINNLIIPNTDGVMFHFNTHEDIKLRYEFLRGKAGVGQEANALVDINRDGTLSINKYYLGWGHKNEKGNSKLDEEYSVELSEEDLKYYVGEFIKPGAEKARVEAFKAEIRKMKVSDSLTAILNAFVDIAKDPYISRGNWTTSTTNTGNFMLRVGVHPLYVTAFMAQPIIKKYIEYQSGLESILNNNSGDIKSKFKRSLVLDNLAKQSVDFLPTSLPLSLIYQKLLKTYSSPITNLIGYNAKDKLQKLFKKEKLSDEQLDEVLEILKQAHSEIFSEQKTVVTDANLKKLRNQIKDVSEGAFQIAILDKFYELQEISKAVRENVMFSKLDTNGMGKNISSLYSLFNLRQHILNKETSDNAQVLIGFQSKLEGTPLGVYFDSLKEVMRIVQANPSLFPQGQKDVQGIFNEISQDLYSNPLINDELATELEKNYYTYSMSNFGPFNMSSFEIKEILSKLPGEFANYKKDNKNKYLILDELQIRNNGKLKIIGLNNRKKSVEFEENFTNSWRDLMIENPKLAEDLIKYSFLVSGFKMNSTQFYTYIPHEYMLNEGINQFVKAFSKEAHDDFIDKFYLNNSDNYKYVRKIFDNEIVSEDFVTGFIVKESGKARYYIKRDNGDGVYRLAGYNKNKQAVYVRAKTLGYKIKGSHIFEYGDDFTKNVPENVDNTYIDKLLDTVVMERNNFNEQFVLDELKQKEEEDIVETDNTIQNVSEDYGVVQVDTKPSLEKTQKFVDILKPQIKTQTYKENKGKFANEMFHYGLMWSRTKRGSKPIKIEAFEKAGYYSYHELDQNGNKLPSLSELQPIIDEIQEKLGIDMSDYDSVIGNIYLDGQYVYPHKDTTESLSARNYPVIVYTIGNKAGLGIVDNNKGKMTFANQYDKQWLPQQDKLKGYTNELQTENGSIYTFGLDGKGRFELTHSTPTGSKKVKNYPEIELPNGDKTSNYTITLTFRRAQDLNENIPQSPNKLNDNINNAKTIAKSEQLDLFEETVEPLTPKVETTSEVKTETVTPQTTEPITSMSEITSHSGGAKGYDAEWDLIGAEFGMVNNKHYLLPSDGNVADSRLIAKGVKPVDATTDVGVVNTTGSATGEGQIKATQAERQMGRIEPTHFTRDTKKIRNWAQVKNADAIFAVASLIDKGSEISINRGKVIKIAKIPQVNGGTSGAVQMAINEGKPAYVFNQVANTKYPVGWYMWNSAQKDFVSIDTPILTREFAGVGTSSNTTEIGKQAIRDVYQKTKDSLSNQTVEKPIKLENEDVMKAFLPKIESINEVEIGQYVSYNNETYIITKENSNGTIQIYNPNIKGAKGKISVSKDKLSKVNGKAKVVTYKSSEYLVTPNNTIISTVTSKIMNWTDNDGNRLAIMALANNDIVTPPTTFLEEVKEFVKSKEVVQPVFKPANKQQSDAIEAIQDFIKNGKGNEIFILEGKAGTGKTTIMQEALAEAIAANKRVHIAALSHKAKLVLASKINQRFLGKTGSSSIAGLLGMKMNEETGEFEPGFGLDRPVESAEIIVIDEASMVNEEALELIMSEKRRDAKVIFLGDRGQLPPIRKISSDEISLVFQSENKSSLTERVRQGEESPILPFADYFWDNSELEKPKANPIPDGKIEDKLSDKGNLVFIKNLYDSFNDVVQVFKQGIETGNPNVIKIVTYKNATRKDYNNKIRKAIFGEDVVQFVEKDQIMFQNNYSLDIRTNFSNSDEFNISSVVTNEMNGYKVFEIGVKMDSESSKITYFPVLDSEYRKQFDEDVSKMFDDAKKMPKGELRKMAYQKAWALTRMFADIDYSYAITSHKSQGSTYDNVIVDLKDIYSVGATSNKSKSQSAYTGLTRGKNTAIIITSKAETNDANVRKSLGVTETSEEIWNKNEGKIKEKFPDLTFENFSEMSIEEQEKLIECLK
jgi:hypothetical protein